jgi:hypothetical protein
MSKIVNHFFGLFKSKSEQAQTQQADSQVVLSPGAVPHQAALEGKRYKRDVEPQRKFYLWGKDPEGSPAFLILYGIHEFVHQEEGNNILKDQVGFREYTIFRGKDGHFPSFEAVDTVASYPEYKRKMYYKRDISDSYYTMLAKKDRKPLPDYHELKNDEIIYLPWNNEVTYDQCLQIVKDKQFRFHKFILADSPQDILNMDEALAAHYDTICQLLSNPNIYMRKKYLKELISQNPSRDLYHYLLRVGSCELISGLFLELALQRNDVLAAEAQKLYDTEITWASESYQRGLKRCLALYGNSFDAAQMHNRMKEIRVTLPEMDLRLVYLNHKVIPENKIISGKTYRRYAMQGLLNEYTYEYSSEERGYLSTRKQKMYAVSSYCDGVAFDVIKMKNTIQEAQIYGLHDVLGKIAYYLDAPHLYYYFTGIGNQKGKVYRYYRRYLRRIFDASAKTKPDQFMQAMKVLLTSYQEEDYLSEFEGDFQFNYFIKQYLYHYYEQYEHKEKYQWAWLGDKEVAALDRRYEYMPEIWDNHIEDVIEITAKTRIPLILRALFFILKDYDKNKKLSIAQLVLLADTKYQALTEYIIDKLKEQLGQTSAFDIDRLLCLLNCTNGEVHQLAVGYFNANKNNIGMAAFVSILLCDGAGVAEQDAVNWQQLMKEKVRSFSDEEFILFIDQFIESSAKKQSVAAKQNAEIDNGRSLNNQAEILTVALEQIKNLAALKQKEIMFVLIKHLYQTANFPSDLIDFCEKVFFSVPLHLLREFAEQIVSLPTKKTLPEQIYLLTALIESIKEHRIPPDLLIVEVLRTGAAPSVNIVTTLIVENSDQLESRFSTLLILLESSVVSLNETAKEVFYRLPGEKQKQLHSIIIDSPDQKAYAFGLEQMYKIYEEPWEKIPSEFILQMLQHPSAEVKGYISNKLNGIIDGLGNGDQDLFLYYVKTLLLLPNRLSIRKDHIYHILPQFVRQYSAKQKEVERLLLGIGGSNTILDSERALVTLAAIKKEVG